MGEMISQGTFDIMRVGEQRGDRARRAQNAQWVVGALLSAAGLAKGGWLGAIAAATGATVLVSAALRDERLRRFSTDRKSFDMVDKQSLESFPASDPPASTQVD
jgi:hypothetical protein